MKNTNLKIIITDDDLLFSESLKVMIETSMKYQVVALASNGVELLRILDKTSCDFILMDIMMDKMDGIEATRKVKQKYPDIKIIGISGLNDDYSILKMLNAGAKGYISKSESCKKLFEAISMIVNGNLYYPEYITERINDKIDLSDKEYEIINLTADGFSIKEISNKVFLAGRTIEKIKQKLIKNFGAKNVPNLIKITMAKKLIKSK
jgi:DNA-binding NarL/FixJ family response regulator